jgi:hypothetical protein
MGLGFDGLGFRGIGTHARLHRIMFCAASRFYFINIQACTFGVDAGIMFWVCNSSLDEALILGARQSAP